MEINKDYIRLSMSITHHQDKPAIVVKRTTTDAEQIKQLIRAALNEQPLIFYPSVRDKRMALASLQNKGIIYFDSDKEEYEFLI